MMERINDPVTHKITDAAMEVHNTIGFGFQELIDQGSLSSEMKRHGLTFIREKSVPISDKGRKVGERRVDFLVDGRILVEIKAQREPDALHIVQAINDLEAFNREYKRLSRYNTFERTPRKCPSILSSQMQAPSRPSHSSCASWFKTFHS